MSKTAVLTEAYNENDYRRSVRAAVRSLWAGATTIDDFFDTMTATVRRGLNAAWMAGAGECGITPADYTPEEKAALQAAIHNENTFIFRFGEAIENANKTAGAPLEPLLNRADMWINRFSAVKMQANAMACGDRKKEWIVPANGKKHCNSCLKLHGQVRRNSVWSRNGILPRQAGAGYLTCRGFKCGCVLSDTSKPISRGPLPSLP